MKTLTTSVTYRHSVRQPHRPLHLPEETIVQVQVIAAYPAGAVPQALFGAFPELGALDTETPADEIKTFWNTDNDLLHDCNYCRRTGRSGGPVTKNSAFPETV